MLLFVWFGFHNHVMLTCLPVMQRLQKPLAATRTGKVYSSHVAFKLLLNFHFSNWWVWPSLKVSATLNWEQERDKWIITILKTREIPAASSLYGHICPCFLPLPQPGSPLLSVIVAGSRRTVDDHESSTSWLFTSAPLSFWEMLLSVLV